MRLAIVVTTLVALEAGALAQQAPTGPDGEPLGCGEPIDADDKTRTERAAEQYDRGRDLYANGQYELAIEAFRAAYCVSPVPVPDAIHAIGKCYEGLVDYENAVKWYEMYIRLVPEKADEVRLIGNRVARLRELPARIRVATDPPMATIVLERDGVEVRRGQANRDAIKVPAGSYKLRAELPGYQPETVQVDAEIGQPYTFSLRLVPKTGKLEVTAYPGDARIYVDGRIVGIGAASDRHPIGSHVVTVEAADRPREVREVVLTADKTTSVHVKMRPPRPQNGRYELLIAGALIGIADGIAAGLALDEQPEVIAGLAAFGGALGFFTPLLFTGEYVPVGRTSTVIGASFVGLYEGALIGTILFADELDDNQADPAFQKIVLVGLASSILFTGGAWLITDRVDVSAGDAALLNSGAVWGGMTGLLLAAAFEEERLLEPLALAGINLGILAGALLGTQYEYSRGHVALIDLAGFAGLVSGAAIATFATEDGQSAARFGLAGTAIGLIAGAFITRKMDAEDEIAPTLNVTEDAAGKKVSTMGFVLRW